MRLLERFNEKLDKIFPPGGFNPPTSGHTLKMLILLCCLWFLTWSLLPIISLDNAFIDVLENIVWGSHFQFGYDKNPYFGAWLGYWTYRLSGNSLWCSYLISQLCILSAFICIWKLSRKLQGHAESFVSVTLLFFITFYGIKSVELCDDVIELGLWPLTILFFYKALKEDKNNLASWFWVGVFSGLSFMTKYYGAVLFISMAGVLLFSLEGRKAFKTPGPYLAGLIFIVISAPNIYWLWQNDFVAFGYALVRADLGHSNKLFEIIRHIENPFSLLERTLGVIIVPVIIFFLLFFRRQPPEKRRRHTYFDKLFVILLSVGPFGLTFLFSLLTGASINYSWVLPCFPLLGLALVFFYQPAIGLWNYKTLLAVLVINTIMFGLIFSIRSLYHQNYRKSGCDYENFPGKAISSDLTRKWREKYNLPLAYVIGERMCSCNLALYSPDNPKAYFSGNPAFSQWIDEKSIKRKGGILIWEDDPKSKPHWVKKFLSRNPEIKTTPIIHKKYERAVSSWFKSIFGAPKKKGVCYCYIPPEKFNADAPYACSETKHESSKKQYSLTTKEGKEL